MRVDWSEIVCLMEVSAVLYKCTYCVFTLNGSDYVIQWYLDHPTVAMHMYSIGFLLWLVQSWFTTGKVWSSGPFNGSGLWCNTSGLKGLWCPLTWTWCLCIFYHSLMCRSPRCLPLCTTSSLETSVPANLLFKPCSWLRNIHTQFIYFWHHGLINSFYFLPLCRLYLHIQIFFSL